MIVIMSLVLAFLFLLGVPIVFVLGLISLCYVLIGGEFNLLIMFPQRMFKGLDLFILLAVPLFALAGNLMNTVGITQRLLSLVKSAVGHITGGLAQVTVITNMIMGGISGSAVADATAIGSVMIPSMVEDGYESDFSAAINSVAATVGPIIPPSIPFVIFAAMSNVSVAALFLGGVVPGVLLSLSLMIPAYFYARRMRIPKTGAFSFRNFSRTFVRSVPALLFPVIIFAGIFGGVFTPTEAAGVGVIYAVLIGAVYRTLSLKSLADNLIDIGIMLGAVMPIVSTSMITAWILGSVNITGVLTNLLFAVSHERWVILLIINLFLLVVGCLMETASSIILFTPILMPIAQLVGVDPVHLGVIVVLNLIIGLSTPPVGVSLFVCCRIANISLERISRAAWPLLVVAVAVLFFITYMPDLVMYLPNLLPK
jgi:C4-dicarboxylate transporter, DctM subunit